MEKMKNMTPQEVVTELDKYIIGQAEAKECSDSIEEIDGEE